MRTAIRNQQGIATAASPSSGTTPLSRTRVMKIDTDEPTVTPSSAIHRGDVFWIAPDDTRGTGARILPSARGGARRRLRPLAHHDRHRVRLDLEPALAREPGNVLLDAGEGSLPKQSVVVVSQISSVDKTRLGERIGSLSGTRVEAILAGLRFQQVSFFGR